MDASLHAADGATGTVLYLGHHLADFLGGQTGALGQFAHFVGDDGKAAPCSPARAASMAALRANRLVWSAISLMVLTMEVM
jgi:hypothetical protein